MAVSPNAARAYAYLVGRGFSPNAAAGIVGNLMQESYDQLDTGAAGDQGTAGGVAQWRGDRLSAMRAYKDPTARDELERQLSFLVSELGGAEKRAGGMLRGAGDLGAGVRGGLAYERPLDAQGNEYAMRYAKAQQVLADAGVSAGEPGAAQAAASVAASGVSNIAEMKARLKAEFPQLRITSEDRSPEYNKKVGGAGNSQHTHGTAFDVGLRGLPEDQQKAIINRAVELGARGIGYYPGSTSAHIDMRQGAGAAWGPNYSYSSIGKTPGWFQEAANRVRSGQNVASAAPSGGGVTGGGGNVTAPPPTPEAPPDYASLNLASGMDMLSGGTGADAAVEQVSAQPAPPQGILAPEPMQTAGPAEPQVAQGGDDGAGQASAATLMATLLDNKRQQRAGMPPGLLG
jgi:hypothetical protein